MCVSNFLPVCLWLIVALSQKGVVVGSGDLCGSYDVLIVGAGFAGLAAAKELKDNNSTTSYRILESTYRVGGRVSSIKLPPNFGGIWVEEGANWISEFEGNPMWKLAKKYGKNITFQNFFDYKMFEYHGASQVGSTV